MDIFAIRTQIHNWIADDLSEAVISGPPAAIGFKDSNVTLPQHVIWRDDGACDRTAA